MMNTKNIERVKKFLNRYSKRETETDTEREREKE